MGLDVKADGLGVKAMGMKIDDDNQVTIITLGDFDIRYQGQSLLVPIQRSYKLLELLQYFIAFSKRRLLPEVIIDDLWPDVDSHDPKNILRVQVYRLRKALKGMAAITDHKVDLALNLTYSNGYYLFEIGDRCQLDTQGLKEIVTQAERVAKTTPTASIELYKQALVLYRGCYMNGICKSEWLIPLQNRYHRFYQRALYNLLQRLAANKLYREIIQVYEQASLIDPFEERLHQYFIQALIGLDDIKGALDHYNYSTSLLYRELGIKPSAIMRGLYEKIQWALAIGRETPGLSLVNGKEAAQIKRDTIYCDPDRFCLLCRLKQQRLHQGGVPSFLGLISVQAAGTPLTNSAAQLITAQLVCILQLSLRQGDALTLWKRNEIRVLLSACSQSDLNAVAIRLHNNFKHIPDFDRVEIDISFEALDQDNAIIS